MFSFFLFDPTRSNSGLSAYDCPSAIGWLRDRACEEQTRIWWDFPHQSRAPSRAEIANGVVTQPARPRTQTGQRCRRKVSPNSSHFFEHISVALFRCFKSTVGRRCHGVMHNLVTCITTMRVWWRFEWNQSITWKTIVTHLTMTEGNFMQVFFSSEPLSQQFPCRSSKGVTRNIG